jgi:hypothetical protein
LTVQVFVVVFVLARATLFLLSGLAALLAALTFLAILAGLSGLVAVLSRLSTLLTRLATLLFIFFHIVCHEIVLLWRGDLAHSPIKIDCLLLVAAAEGKVGG